MKNTTAIWVVIIIIVVVILGFWFWSYTSQPSSSTAGLPPLSAVGSTSGTAPNGTVVLSTATTSTLGTYLVASNGMTLYEYTKDTPGVSACTGQCAAVWPPYTVPIGDANATLVGDATAPGQVGTLTRSDGTMQVTYNGIPLYFYSKDQSVGDVNGQDVGGVWFIVSPIASSSSTTSGTSATSP